MSGVPRAELDAPFSDENAEPTLWTYAEAALEDAGVYWVVTVRDDGRPHVTPVAGAWVDGAFYFSTGNGEQKAKNLSRNDHIAIVTGCNDFTSGLDVIVDGRAVKVTDETTAEQLAKVLNEKYDNFFNFTADGSCFSLTGGGTAELYTVERRRAFAYARGDSYSATRYV